jgi:hypothetical protein
VLTRLWAAALTSALVAAPVAVPSASAVDGACVTKQEFKAVKQGWTPRRVAHTFDTNGKRVTLAAFSEVRRYEKCNGETSVIVNYERKAAGKPLALTSKYW